MTEASELRFPVFEEPDMFHKSLTMEAYARFVQEGWKNAPQRERQIALRRRLEPQVRFTLK